MEELTKRQRQALKAIYHSMVTSGYPPTLADLREELDVSSNQAVLDLLKILEDKGFIKKEEGMARGIRILRAGYNALGVRPTTPYLGITAAGPYMQAFEDFHWESRGDVEMSSEKVFLVRIKGDSMTGADINDGDMAIVKEVNEFKNGDIVLARNHDETTVKRLVNMKGRVYLKPENSKYKNIPIYPETRLIGKIIGIVEES